jgi:hypothetical protein
VLVIRSHLDAFHTSPRITPFITGGLLDVMESFFTQSKFSNNPTEIKTYVCWAIRGDGPAYYKLPTPQNCKLP